MPMSSNNSFSEFAHSLISRATSTREPITISLVGGGGKTQLLYRLANEYQQFGHNVCVTTTTKMYFPNAPELNQVTDFASHSPIPSTGIAFVYSERLCPNDNDTKVKVRGLSNEQIESLKHQQLYSVFIVEADGSHRLPLKAPARHEPCIPNHSDVVIGVTGADPILNPANPEAIHRWNEFSMLTKCNEGSVIGKNQIQALVHSDQGLFKGCSEQQKKIWVINRFDLASDKAQLTELAKQIFDEEPQLAQLAITQMTTDNPIHHIFNRTL
ncbi:putative selenium-dependent hydroxylase accessory protein YqeC [Vibrio mediterranei]|nr:putative selenium-dependent hydroxylase accessory protein YqeC [Vibrio mediterranei]